MQPTESKHGFVWIILLLTIVASYGCRSPAYVLNGLDLKLTKELTTDLSKNEAVSPFVVANLLSQVMTGAGGATKTELSTVLGVDPNAPNSFLSGYQSAISYLSSSSGQANTSVFNGIYLKKDFPVKQSFSQTLMTYYGAEVNRFSTPKQAATDINQAVADTTNNLIKDLVSEKVLVGAKMILVTALYFKAFWLYKFPVRNTREEDFLTSDGTKQVQMMGLFGKSFKYVHKPTEFDAISLPYEDTDYSMILIRPLEKNMASVNTMLSSLSSVNVAQLVDDMTSLRCDVKMPRFLLEKKYDDNLKAALGTMGIRKMFSDQADLSGMSHLPLQADKFILKVFMNVTEVGTEAAGAGAITIIVTGLPEPPQVNFTLDRPFFAILWNSAHRMSLFEAYVGSP